MLAWVSIKEEIEGLKRPMLGGKVMSKIKRFSLTSCLYHHDRL